MRLSVAMMVDGNSRFAFTDVLRRNGWNADDLAFPPVRERALVEYSRRLGEVYVENARWCIRLGEELLERVEDSDYSVFVYNAANRSREHFSCIDAAIRAVGGELASRLGRFGPVCLVGPREEKQNWFSLFPSSLCELDAPESGENRSVIITGYQHGSGCAEDSRAKFMRPIDYFVRSTQMRFSGMYLPALANSRFVVLSHIPCMYPPRLFAEALVESARADEEHDDLNVYSPRVYAAWLEHYSAAPAALFTSNALPLSVKTFPAAQAAVV